MSAWCTETHGRSGLTAACIASSTTAEEAADDLYAYIRKYVSEPTRGVLAGNCIHCDRDYLRKEPYKKIIDYLHYRIFDVATITGAADRWAPEVLQGLPKRKGLHQAREDVLESIEYARFFRKAFFSKSAESLKDKRLRQDTILSDMVKSQ
jgi:oligoribonuclease